MDLRTNQSFNIISILLPPQSSGLLVNYNLVSLQIYIFKVLEEITKARHKQFLKTITERDNLLLTLN